MSQPKFQQFARSYDKATPIQTEVAFFLARFLAQQISIDTHASEQTWLDVGCGTGKLSQAVLKNFSYNLPFVTLNGVDNSQAMLDIWQANLNHQGSAVKLTPTLADMTALPFKDKSMDVVMSSFALHWATPQVIQELGRVVKSGGYLYLAIPVQGSFSQVKARFPDLPIYPFLPSDEWKAALGALIENRRGEVRFFEERSFGHIYPNLKTLLTELKYMGGAVSGQSPMTPAVLRQYLQDKSPIVLDYQMLIAGILLR